MARNKGAHIAVSVELSHWLGSLWSQWTCNLILFVYRSWTSNDKAGRGSMDGE